MKIVATIEARMSSSRLPGKVLLPAAEKPLLRHQIERIRQVSSIDEIVVATTINRKDASEQIKYMDQQGVKRWEMMYSRLCSNN